MLEAGFDLVIDGQDFVATAGDLIRLPMTIPHGIFTRRSDREMHVLGEPDPQALTICSGASTR